LTVYEREIGNTTLGEPALVIAADTVVVGHGGAILEKPRSEREHIEMLTSLRDGFGGIHKVYTGVAVMSPLESARDPGYAMESHVEETLVKFDSNGEDIFFHWLLSFLKQKAAWESFLKANMKWQSRTI